MATSFKAGDKFFIGGDKLLPLEKYLPKHDSCDAEPDPEQVPTQTKTSPRGPKTEACWWWVSRRTHAWRPGWSSGSSKR